MQHRAFQFSLKSGIGGLLFIGYLFGIWRLPAIYAAELMLCTLVIAFTTAVLGVILSFGRAKRIATGAVVALAMSTVLHMAESKGFVKRQLESNSSAFIDYVLTVSGQQTWTAANFEALDSLWTNTTTLLLGVCGGLIGSYFRR